MEKTANKLVGLKEFTQTVRNWQAEGLSVVFTNGCFDVIHLGHVEYLEKARAFGDRLVVGMNADASVSKLKGPGRPVNGEDARARVLGALQFVDLVTVFEEETPYELIAASTPDILVKGSDYEVDNIVGADIVKRNGGEVKTVPLTKGFSTSELIRKIENK